MCAGVLNALRALLLPLGKEEQFGIMKALYQQLEKIEGLLADWQEQHRSAVFS
jgi:hypothetical protein